MPRRVHPIPAGILASFVGVAIFEVAASWGLVIRQLGFASPGGRVPGESWSAWFGTFEWLKVPSLFLVELLAGWALYQLLRKTGRFTLGEAVGRHALITVVLGLLLWPFFFVWLSFLQLGLTDPAYHVTMNEILFAILRIFRAPILFLLALLVGWAAYQRLRKTGRFTPGRAVGLPALVGAIVGPVPFFFFWPLVLAGMIGWGAAGATFWALVPDGRGASAA